MTGSLDQATWRAGPQPERVAASLQAFERWLDDFGYTSNDQYDFWATVYGIWSKGWYYRHGKLAAPLVLPLVAADWLLPGSRRWFSTPQRFAIGDAHYLMGFVALYRATHEPRYLAAATDLADALLASAIPGFSGHCWGYPFDWQTRRGLWKRNTPLVTSTPYVFDAFVHLHAATGAGHYLDVARSIAHFVATDIRDTPVGDGQAAGYTPVDQSQVVNASSYRAACMAEASQLTGNERYRHIAEGNARFVLAQQRPDGAWPYSASDPHDRFVDHFHTCFVLGGLYRTYRVLQDPALLSAVERGYAYYRKRLFYPDGRPRRFAETARPHLSVVELYDHAEALKLALLLRPDLPTGDMADSMAGRLVELQTTAGCFVTRISAWGRRNTVPYHRWAQSQAFCALARYYEHLMRSGAGQCRQVPQGH